MNINLPKSWVSFFISLLLFSCGAPDSRFISQVESLEKTIFASEQSLQGIDTSKIGNYFRISNENLKFIQENMDTMDKQTAILVADYSASRKSLRMFLENYSDVSKELGYSKKQLNDLKTDIEKNLVAEDKFTDYYSAESKSVDKLSELVENLVQWYSSALKMYEAKSPAVERLILQMREEKERKSSD